MLARGFATASAIPWLAPARRGYQRERVVSSKQSGGSAAPAASGGFEVSDKGGAAMSRLTPWAAVLGAQVLIMTGPGVSVPPPASPDIGHFDHVTRRLIQPSLQILRRDHTFDRLVVEQDGVGVADLLKPGVREPQRPEHSALRTESGMFFDLQPILEGKLLGLRPLRPDIFMISTR